MTNEMKQDSNSTDAVATRRLRRGKHGFFGGLFLGGLGGLLAALVVGAIVPVAAGGLLSHRGHGRFGFGMHDPATAKEHADVAVEFLLRGIDATADQQSQVKAVVGSAIDDILPVAERHQANREALVEELSRATIDRLAIEEIRRAELELADQVSSRLILALTDAAETLTPEQRAELIERAQKFRH